MVIFYYRKQIDITCLLLQKLLPIIASKHAFNKYSVSIERSLNHPSETVKATILSEVNIIINY